MLLSQRILARRHLLEFTKQTYPGNYLAGWVHKDICERLDRFSKAVGDGKSPRLMLLMPPRTGKSELASVRFPAWHLGHYPNHEIIDVGYNFELPTGFSRRTRMIMRSPKYMTLFPNAVLAKDSQGVEAWHTEAGGGETIAGVGGGITGKGAHVLIIDDPVKNQEDADNPAYRDRLWDWYQSTAYTRLAPGGGVLVIQTWWNDDDLAGRLQTAGKENPEADQFEVVKYPAISEFWEYKNEKTLEIIRTEEPMPAPYDPGIVLLRPKGVAVHPQRYTTEAMQKIKANLQPRIWSALYQQNPMPDEGVYFRKEDFTRYSVAPSTYGGQVVTAWDFAIGEKELNDWTVGATLLQTPGDMVYVLEVRRMKTDSLGIVDAMVDTAEKWSQPGATYRLAVEDGQIWKSLRPLFERRCAEEKVYPPLEVMRPLTDKLARARPLQGRMQQHRVMFPQSALWVDQAVQEMLRFPAGAHDDVVDAVAWAMRLIVDTPPPAPQMAKDVKSWRDKLRAGAGAADRSWMAE
jgi:predicted phage terminase large subunit-like protein